VSLRHDIGLRASQLCLRQKLTEFSTLGATFHAAWGLQRTIMQSVNGARTALRSIMQSVNGARTPSRSTLQSAGGARKGPRGVLQCTSGAPKASRSILRSDGGVQTRRRATSCCDGGVQTPSYSAARRRSLRMTLVRVTPVCVGIDAELRTSGGGPELSDYLLLADSC